MILPASSLFNRLCFSKKPSQRGLVGIDTDAIIDSGVQKSEYQSVENAIPHQFFLTALTCSKCLQT